MPLSNASKLNVPVLQFFNTVFVISLLLTSLTTTLYVPVFLKNTFTFQIPWSPMEKCFWAFKCASFCLGFYDLIEKTHQEVFG